MKTPQINTVLDAPVTDKGRKDYTPDHAKERSAPTTEDVNNTAQPADRRYGIESRARWGGTDSESFHTLTTEANAIEQEPPAEEEPAGKGRKGK